MDKTTLEEKKTSLQQQFDALTNTNEQLSKQITDNNQELFRLAGEFRYNDELLSNLIEVIPLKGKK